MGNTKKGFPFGFYVCSLSFTFERLAYYAAKWGLTIFIAAKAVNGGLGLDKTVGATMSANLVALTYITPIIGGYIADRWISPRLLVPIGEILMGLGYLCAWKANGIGMLWAMVILVAVGTGFFKGNVSGINGRLFPLADADELDTVFSLQYSFVNIGSFCGTTFLSLLAKAAGYRMLFLVCGIALFVDCLWWLFGMKFFGDAGKKPFLVDNRVEDVNKEEKDTTPLTKLEKNRVISIIIVTIFSGIFWTIWYMVYNPVYFEFGPTSEAGLGWANWNIGSFTMPTAWFDSMNGLLCIILCPVFAGIWAKMRQRPQGDIGMFKKTARNYYPWSYAGNDGISCCPCRFRNKGAGRYLDYRAGSGFYDSGRGYLLTSWKLFHQQICSEETARNTAWYLAIGNLLCFKGKCRAL